MATLRTHKSKTAKHTKGDIPCITLTVCQCAAEIFTSAKEVMFLPVFVCLSVCVCTR